MRSVLVYRCQTSAAALREPDAPWKQYSPGEPGNGAPLLSPAGPSPLAGLTRASPAVRSACGPEGAGTERRAQSLGLDGAAGCGEAGGSGGLSGSLPGALAGRRRPTVSPSPRDRDPPLHPGSAVTAARAPETAHDAPGRLRSSSPGSRARRQQVRGPSGSVSPGSPAPYPRVPCQPRADPAPAPPPRGAGRGRAQGGGATRVQSRSAPVT